MEGFIRLQSGGLEDFIGRRVTIVGTHPWSGESGVGKEVATAGATQHKGLVVSLDNGMSCYVFGRENLRTEPEKKRKRR